MDNYMTLPQNEADSFDALTSEREKHGTYSSSMIQI